MLWKVGRNGRYQPQSRPRPCTIVSSRGLVPYKLQVSSARPRLGSWVFLPSVPGVCGCCGALRPRYKRLVDNIFPEDPEVGHIAGWHHGSSVGNEDCCKGKAGLWGPSPWGCSDEQEWGPQPQAVLRGRWVPEDWGYLGLGVWRGLWKAVFTCFQPSLKNQDIFLTHLSLGDSSWSCSPSWVLTQVPMSSWLPLVPARCGDVHTQRPGFFGLQATTLPSGCITGCVAFRNVRIWCTWLCGVPWELQSCLLPVHVLVLDIQNGLILSCCQWSLVIHSHTHISVYTHTYTHMHIYFHVCSHTCMCSYIHTCTYIYFTIFIYS